MSFTKMKYLVEFESDYLSNQNQIKEDFESILAKTKEFDSCLFQEEILHGKPVFNIKHNLFEYYWIIRRELEEKITKLMKDIRKSIDSIPPSMKSTTKVRGYDADGLPTYTLMYSNINYKKLLNFFHQIEEGIEDSKGIIDCITSINPIDSKVRNLRVILLSFLETIELLIPEEMISTEKEVTIILTLEEKGMEKSVEELEAIIQAERGRDKCLRARTALEQVLVHLLETKNIKQKKRSFYSNLHQCLKNDLIDKDLEKTIGTHYSFISKICHSEIEDSASNVQFAIKNIFLIIEKIIGLNNKT